MIPTPTIVIERFFTKYRPDPSDAAKMRGIDWITYGPLGSKERTNARIADIDRVVPAKDMDNPAVAMAYALRDFIMPRYRAWKEGQEMPEEGTPLSAFNLLSPEQAEVFRLHGVKTVEQIVSMSSGHAEKIPLPHMADIVQQAKRFIDSADQTRAAAEAVLKDRRIQELEEAKADSDATVKELLKRVDALASMVADNQDRREAPLAPDGRPDTPGVPGGAQPRKKGRPTNAERAARQEAQAAAG